MQCTWVINVSKQTEHSSRLVRSCLGFILLAEAILSQIELESDEKFAQVVSNFRLSTAARCLTETQTERRKHGDRNELWYWYSIAGIFGMHLRNIKHFPC